MEVFVFGSVSSGEQDVYAGGQNFWVMKAPHFN